MESESSLIRINKALFITYIGVAAAIVGINLAFTGHHKYAVVALVVAGLCDFLDGRVARRLKLTENEKKFGVQADSLADVISFTVFPSIIFISLQFSDWYHMIGYILLVLAGIMRLGQFNLVPPIKNRKYYVGLPVTYTAIIYPILYLLSNQLEWTTSSLLVFITTLLTAMLFVTKLSFRKPSGLWNVIILLLAVGLITLTLMFG